MIGNIHNSKGGIMNPIDGDTLQWILGILSAIVAAIATRVLRLIWVNHKSLHELREELLKNYPTKEDMQRCKDDTDQRLADIIVPLKEGHSRIEGKLDSLLMKEYTDRG